MDIAGNIQASIANCGRTEQRAPITEPVVVATTFITGGTIEVSDTCVRFVAWEKLPRVEGDEMVERRIVARLVMSTDVARELVTNWRKALEKGGH